MKKTFQITSLFIIIAVIAFAAGKVTNNHSTRQNLTKKNSLYENAGMMTTSNTAETMIKSFQNAYPDEIKARLFSKEKIEALLNQPGCQGLRIYNGINTDGEKDMILVATDSHFNDMLKSANNPTSDAVIVLTGGTPCPTMCADTLGRPANH